MYNEKTKLCEKLLFVPISIDKVFEIQFKSESIMQVKFALSLPISVNDVFNFQKLFFSPSFNFLYSCINKF